MLGTKRNKKVLEMRNAAGETVLKNEKKRGRESRNKEAGVKERHWIERTIGN